MVIEPLTRHHERAAFNCGQESLDTYLKQHARQNDEKGLSRTFVAVEDVGRAAILGYCTLSTGSISFEHLPSERLPRYPIPTVLLARLAVSRSRQGLGLGKLLLLDALRRSERISQETGVRRMALRRVGRNRFEAIVPNGVTSQAFISGDSIAQCRFRHSQVRRSVSGACNSESRNRSRSVIALLPVMQRHRHFRRIRAVE